MVDQPLRQHVFDTRSVYNAVAIGALQTGDLDALTQLFGWLLRQLPETTILYYVIDGIYLLEREQFQGEGLPALLSLIRLAEDGSFPPPSSCY